MKALIECKIISNFKPLMKYLEDTIAAISTAIGEAGISVIRISGKDAIKIADRVFRGKKKLEEVKTHTAHYGSIVDSTGKVVDYVVATVFRAPHSYTGEDTVEISCHGGIFVTRKVLETILEAGARLAQPGEFTKRAFLNGRIDLSQAEAIADLIRSVTDLAYQSSLSQLEGSLSRKIKKMRDDLINLCSLVELELDYTNALKELYENNPDIKQAEYQIELSRSLISLELSGHLPALFLTGNLQYQAQANDFNFNRYRWIRTTFIGLQLQIPIFRGFGTQARIDQARVSLQQSTERLRFIKQALENELKGTIYKIEQSKKRIEAQKKAVELAELGYKIARKRFESGVGTQLEVSNAEVNFAQARLNYQQAIYDYLTALSDLERLIGKINY